MKRKNKNVWAESSTTKLSLLTDFYQLSMAYAYFKAGIDRRRAVFHLFFRRPPFQGGFTVAAGLESALNFIEQFRFEASDIEYLKTIPGEGNRPYFDASFLDMLRRLRLKVDLYAVPEGTIIFPYEPLVRVEGPLLQCQFLESILLNLFNFPSLIATKAARVCLAAGQDPVIEFGLRRAQGIDGAVTASRAAFLGGCSATSNTLAGKLFDIPVQGTQAHSWIMAFDTEEEAFSAYAEALPHACVFLVDTYDTIAGVKKAIQVGKEMRKRKKKLLGIRLDSGDLAALSIEARKLLDENGFHETCIIASNELDEVVIADLKKQGAKIDTWGVGTNLVTGKGSSALDGVYKLSAIEDEHGSWKYTLKLSEQLVKISNPGILQVRRFSKQGHYVGDVLYDEGLKCPSPCDAVDPFDPSKIWHYSSGMTHCDLLGKKIEKGKKIVHSPSLKEIRTYTKEELTRFSQGVKRFLNPHIYSVGMENNLYQFKMNLVRKIREKKR